MTSVQLAAVFPHAGAPRLALFGQPLNDAMAEFDINTPKRQASFIAQIAHETGELRYLRELGTGNAYEGRVDLGNVQPGDGSRYRGGGGLQATGRLIYSRLTSALGLDLLNHPELIEQPEAAMRSAGWIWTIDKDLNGLADADAFGAITHRINGGFVGLDQRLGYWLKARKAVGL